jgi:hypothetical protein
MVELLGRVLAWLIIAGVALVAVAVLIHQPLETTSKGT